MSNSKKELSGPDLAEGIAFSTIADGAMLLGHANGEAVLLARRGSEVFAIGATCTHYGAPLARGLEFFLSAIGHYDQCDLSGNRRCISSRRTCAVRSSAVLARLAPVATIHTASAATRRIVSRASASGAESAFDGKHRYADSRNSGVRATRCSRPASSCSRSIRDGK